MKKIFDSFLSILSVIPLFFLGKGSMEGFSVIALNQKTAATITEWKIYEMSPSKVALVAKYNFNVEGQIFHGETVFQKVYYLNSYAAGSALKEMEKRQWNVWYRETNPLKSSLQKIFPFKNLIRGFITTLVWIYFFCLKVMFVRRSSSDRLD